MKKVKFYIFIFFCFLLILSFFGFSFALQPRFYTFEGNDDISFQNETSLIQWGGSFTDESYNNSYASIKTYDSYIDLAVYSKNPNDTSSTYLQFSGLSHSGSFQSISSNPNAGGSFAFIDWTDGSLSWIQCGYFGACNLVYSPTYSKIFSPSYQWTNPTSLNGVTGLRFFKGGAGWKPSLYDSLYLQNYGFLRASLIMSLQTNQIDYYSWNGNSYSKYSRGLYSFFPDSISTTYLRSYGSTQAFILSDSSDNKHFTTLLSYDEENPGTSPSYIDNVLLVSTNGPDVSSTGTSSSMVAFKVSSVNTGGVDYTMYDCASPDVFLFDSSMCNVVSAGYLMWKGSTNVLSAGTYGSFFSPNIHRFMDYSMSLAGGIVGSYQGGLAGSLVFVASGSDQILPNLEIKSGGGFVGGGGISYGGGAGDDYLPNQSGYNGIYIKSGNIYTATGLSDYYPSTGNLQFDKTGGLKLFSCPYSWSGIITLSLSDMFGGLGKNTWFDIDLFKPVSCLYSAYVVGSDTMTLTSFPTGNIVSVGKFLEFTGNTLYPSVDSSGKNLLVVILNLLLALPALYLFIKWIK